MPILANAKHEAAAQAFITDRERIGWRAYRAVYPQSSQHAAETAWARMLKKAEFSARIAELAEAAVQDAVMSANEVLVELSKIGRANMADYIRAFACGDPVAGIDKLTPAQAAALGEVTVEQLTDGRDEDAREVRRIRYKLANKIEALQLLGKHHRLYVERREHEGTGIAERLAAALARVDGEPAQQNEPHDSKVRSPAARGPHRHAHKAARKDKRARRRRESE